MHTRTHYIITYCFLAVQYLLNDYNFCFPDKNIILTGKIIHISKVTQLSPSDYSFLNNCRSEGIYNLYLLQ